MTARLARALIAAGCLATAAPAIAAPVAPATVVEPALDALRLEHPELRAVRRAGSPVPTVLTGLAVPTEGADAHARVAGFLARHQGIFGGAELVADTIRTRPGRTLVSLNQTHAGLPVLDRGVTLVLDADGRVVRISGDVRPVTRLERATIDPATAREIAVRHATGASLAEPLPDVPTSIERGIVAVGGHGVEVFEVEVVRQPLAEHFVVRIDAHAGRVLSVRNRVTH